MMRMKLSYKGGDSVSSGAEECYEILFGVKEATVTSHYEPSRKYSM